MAFAISGSATIYRGQSGTYNLSGTSSYSGMRFKVQLTGPATYTSQNITGSGNNAPSGFVVSIPSGAPTGTYIARAYNEDPGNMSQGALEWSTNYINVTVTDYVPPPDPPSVPSSITVPNEIKGGTTISISWGSSSNASSYQLERQINGGSWSQIYSGGNLSYTDTVPLNTWNTVAYRVKATGTGGTSGYRTSNTVPVINNTAPVISGSDANLGTLTTSFPSQSYTVTDAEGGTVSVVEALDGITLRTYNVILGAANSLALSAAQWLEVTNGSHSITITATDSGGLSAVRTFTFAKNITVVEFGIAPLPADDMPTKCVLNSNGVFPTGCILKVWVCNNANDASPTWEDTGDKTLTGKKIYLLNTTKTAPQWAFGVKARLERGTATATCALDAIKGNFE